MKHERPRAVDVSQIRLRGGPFEGRTMQSDWLPKTFAMDGARYEFRGYEACYEFVGGAVEADEGAQNQAREALQAWAARYPDLAPAAQDGYDVTREVVDAITADVAARLEQAGLTVTEGGAVEDGERRAPRPEALEKRELARAALHAAEEALVPPCVTTEVGRIVRLVLGSTDESGAPRKTGFVVSVACSALNLSRAIAVVTE